MTWNIYKIPPQKVGIDTRSKISKFLLGDGTHKAENLNALQGVDLNIELEGASSAQKLLVLSGIKYYLNYFHAGNQHETFDSLNLIGTTFKGVMNSPDIGLDLRQDRSPTDTVGNIFETKIFTCLLTGIPMALNALFEENATNEEMLLDMISNNRYFPSISLVEKAFLSIVILAEPELILNIPESILDINRDGIAAFQDITKVIEQAQHNIVQESFLQAIFGKEVELDNLSDAIFHEIITHQGEINTSLLETFLKLLNKPENYSISDKLKINPSKDIPEVVNHKIIQYLDESSIINCILASCEQQNDYVEELGNIPVIVN